MDYPQIEDAWVWPGKVERWFRERTVGHTLHVCNGKSTLGDVRVDANPTRVTDVQGDMFDLPFPPRTFDTVVADPPWKLLQQGGLGARHRAFFELLRVCAIDGTVLWNSYSIPTSTQAEVQEVAVRQDYGHGKASVLVSYRKQPGQATLAGGES